MTKVLLHVPQSVQEIVKTLNDKGFEGFLVGGCVRDIMMGKNPNDWDITTNANPEEIQSIFEHTFYENDFGTVGVVNDVLVSEIEEMEASLPKQEQYYEDVSPETKDLFSKINELKSQSVVEITPYRTETGYSDNRRPDEVTFSESIDLDLSRRDFTVNALAYDPVAQELIDQHGGIQDLKDGIIRTVGDPDERFGEDALRILRAVRFTAQLGFTLHIDTFNSIKNTADSLVNISKERIRDEFVKILGTERPKDALFLAHDLGVLQYISHDLTRGIGIEQNGAHKYDVFEHLVRTMQHGADKEWSLSIRLAGLFHDISKPETRRWSKEKGDYTFYGHEVVGARVTRKVLSDLKFPNETIEKVSTLVRWHMFFSDPDEITLSAVRRIIRNVGPENVWDLIRLRICDRIGMGRPKERSYRLRKYVSMMDEAMRSPISVKDLKINGDIILKDYEIQPGRKLGYILKALMAETLETPENNNESYLRQRVAELITMSEGDLKVKAADGEDAMFKAEEEELRKIRRKHKVR